MTELCKGWGAAVRIAAMTTLALSMVVGCTTTGVGTGEASVAGAPPQAVTFGWTSQDGGMSGTMTASVNGKVYQGRFFQITQHTKAEARDPLWVGWRHGWYDWSYWGPGRFASFPTTVFITRYTGKVVASLDAGADHLRCRFHLVEPSRGMAGGGEGECQNGSGQSIRANFAAS